MVEKLVRLTSPTTHLELNRARIEQLFANSGESAIIQQAQEGNEDAFTWIYIRYFPPVYRYFLKMTGYRVIAEDIAQNLFEKLPNGLKHYIPKEDASFDSWFHTVGINQLRQYFRHINYEPKTVSISRELFAKDGDLRVPSAEDVAIKNLEKANLSEADREDIYRALAALTQTQREVLVRRIEKGLTIAETAKELGKSENDIKVLFHNAIQFIKEFITLPAGSKERETIINRKIKIRNSFDREKVTKSILAALQDGKPITTNQLSDICNVTSHAIKLAIKRLQEKGNIKIISDIHGYHIAERLHQEETLAKAS